VLDNAGGGEREPAPATGILARIPEP
jgi:hypothetical protein